MLPVCHPHPDKMAHWGIGGWVSGSGYGWMDGFLYKIYNHNIKNNMNYTENMTQLMSMSINIEYKG